LCSVLKALGSIPSIKKTGGGDSKVLTSWGHCEVGINKLPCARGSSKGTCQRTITALGVLSTGYGVQYPGAVGGRNFGCHSLSQQLGLLGSTSVLPDVHFVILRNSPGQAPVAHACNPSYSGGRDQKNGGSKPAQGNSSPDPSLKKLITKKGLVE
jgi:hypothetical protein